MKKIIQIALLVVAMAFLCGTQGYAARLNSKGQKMVKRIVMIEPHIQTEMGNMVFDYSKDNSLNTITVTMNNDKQTKYIIHRTQDLITAKYYEKGKEVSYRKHTISTDKFGNIETLCSSWVGNDGSFLSEMTKYTYFFDEDYREYRIEKVTSWTQYTDTKGVTRSANNDNEYGEAYWYYVNGNIYSDTKHYIYDKEIHISPKNYGEWIYSETEVDDTNMNLCVIKDGFGEFHPLKCLSFTEWLPYKTHNLVIGTYAGEGQPPIRELKYGYDNEGNIVSVYENNVRWGRWRSNGFVETYRIEYVD